MSEDAVIFLNSIPHTVYGWGWSWWGFVTGLITLLCLTMLALTIKNNWGEVQIAIISLLFIIFCSISIVTFSHSKVVETYETYEVTVNNNTPFVDFYDTFEVINQRGAIFEVRYKEK